MARLPQARTYKRRMACFECRKTFRQRSNHAGKCPQCGGDLHSIGLDFKTPRRRNRQQWKKAQTLAKNGVRFSSYGTGHRPKHLREVRAFLKIRAQQKRKSAGEQLLDKLD